MRLSLKSQPITSRDLNLGNSDSLCNPLFHCAILPKLAQVWIQIHLFSPKLHELGINTLSALKAIHNIKLSGPMSNQAFN